MCGISLAIHGDSDKLIAIKSVNKMSRSISHRGKRIIRSSGNTWEYAFEWLQLTGIEMGQMPNESENWIVLLNGFVSNYKELANKYNIELFFQSDIELLVKFLQEFNLEKLDELNGFFAICAFDKRINSWVNFTDRYGAKQIYQYTNSDGVTFISSEVKGILAACPEIRLDMNAIEDWRCTLGVMNANTIYEGVKRVKKLPFVIPEKIEIPYHDAILRLRDLLIQSFRRNNYTGKKGAYLSGGIDSGLIAKYMRPDYCFSVDYIDEQFSESDLIKKNSVNAHLSLIINEETAQKYAMETMKALDDPKAGSCYTNFAIAELASNFVTVVYSGAGGDEFFGGYPHRKDKYIGDVVKRTSFGEFDWRDEISHFEYDLKFLDAVLVVEDRMSGYHTMETRYPLLDNDLVDFALSLPDEYLENKRILKDVSGLHPDVINGKKKGFSNPYFTNDEWVDFVLKNLKR